MFKKSLKRFVAIMMTAVMVLGTSALVLADQSGTVGGGQGDIEGWVNKKVFSVSCPTASANALNMLVDPQGLIAATDAAAKAGLSANDFEPGAKVLFPRTTGNYKYASESESISMANLGTVSVNYSVSVDIADIDPIILSDNATTINNTTQAAVLFVEMVKGNLPDGTVYGTGNTTRWGNAKTGGIPIGSDDAVVISGNKVVTVSADVADAVEALYKVSWNQTEGYTYGISANSVSTANAAAYADTKGKFAFSFKGTTNNGDLTAWRDAVGAKPRLSVVYTITPIEDVEDASYDYTINAATGTATWDRSKDFTVYVDPSIANLSTGDFMIKYNGSNIYGYTGVYNGNTSLANPSYGFASLTGNVITLHPALASRLPQGETLYIATGTGSENIVARITVN